MAAWVDYNVDGLSLRYFFMALSARYERWFDKACGRSWI